MESPLTAPVSVVIPCYCCAVTIARAMRSVLGQTRLPSEIILVEDASPDNGKTLAALHQWQNSSKVPIPVHIIELERNQGPATARNTGWEAAAQPYVAFLDADDAWHPRKIDIQHGWMAANPEVSICGHGSSVVPDPPLFPALPTAWQARRISAALLLFSNRLPLRSVMVKRDLPLRFDPGKTHAEDYLLWLRAQFAGFALWRLPLPLAFSFKPEFGASGLSGDLWSMYKGEVAAYSSLYRDRLAPRWLLACALLFSLMKFIRRCAVSAIRGFLSK